MMWKTHGINIKWLSVCMNWLYFVFVTNFMHFYVEKSWSCLTFVYLYFQHFTQKLVYFHLTSVLYHHDHVAQHQWIIFTMLLNQKITTMLYTGTQLPIIISNERCKRIFSNILEIDKLNQNYLYHSNVMVLKIILFLLLHIMKV